MGFLNIFKKTVDSSPYEENYLYQPVSGTIISQEEIPDETFSSRMLGKGCGIIPDDGEIYSPVSGKVIFIAETKHAIGLKTINGTEILIHVGIDTIEMNGKGFKVLVKEGYTVQMGEHILTFDKQKIINSGYNNTVILLVTNPDAFKHIELLKSGNASVKEKIIKIE